MAPSFVTQNSPLLSFYQTMKPKYVSRRADSTSRLTLPALATALIALAGTATAIPTGLY